MCDRHRASERVVKLMLPDPLRPIWAVRTKKAESSMHRVIAEKECPEHYKYPIEPAAFCIKNRLPFAEGNVVKYVCRWREKGGVDDLRKARHYLDMIIAEEQQLYSGEEGGC